MTSRGLLPRLGFWFVRFAGGVTAIWGVGVILIAGAPVRGAALIVVGLAAAGWSAAMSPGISSGVGLARDAMRTFDDGRAVRDPGGTSDPTDGGGRFSGR